MKDTTNITHAQLVAVAVRWLREEARCSVIVSERGTKEIPDAIGWGGPYGSVVIECKVSRSDFRADRKKDRNAGRMRYYLTPPGLIGEHEVPRRWGLLTHDGEMTLCRVEPQWWPAAPALELPIALAALGQLQFAAAAGAASDVAGIARAAGTVDQRQDARRRWLDECVETAVDWGPAKALWIVQQTKHPYKTNRDAARRLAEAVETGDVEIEAVPGTMPVEYRARMDEEQVA